MYHSSFKPQSLVARTYYDGFSYGYKFHKSMSASSSGGWKCFSKDQTGWTWGRVMLDLVNVSIMMEPCQSPL